jgi:hypothetical protein
VPIALKSGSLNLLEPSRPVKGLLYLFAFTLGTPNLIFLNLFLHSAVPSDKTAHVVASMSQAAAMA